MKYKILTTQKNIFESFLKTGLIARGLEKKLIEIEIFNLYDYGKGPHKKIDDTPYGGGAGMVLRVDVIADALARIKSKNKKAKIILLTPQGKVLDQPLVNDFSQEKELILISGRFEGYDERIRKLCDEEISIGNFVLTSGDLPAMVLIDAISRQIPKFLEKSESLKNESFKNGNHIEYPQYTKPFDFCNQQVPEVLIGGNHAEIEKWRNAEALRKTKKRT